ncbi:hypothetical protein ALC57_11280 [Trachymyrmex cornetzi]|uniref:Uncharacterized protein n=1 Tax=Trachymyrmex cornetzi TaxID=471704 RepID=A0A195DU24_9HYME|nr:hypothetical protein ALC57_11280 [Trachymyrmex cornetzi]
MGIHQSVMIKPPEYFCVRAILRINEEKVAVGLLPNLRSNRDAKSRPTVLPSIVQDETRVFSSSAIEKLVFIAPLRPGLNHRCSHNFVVSSLGTAHPIPSQAADLLSNIS